ncbi:hypothetical protein KSP39_PZI004473 [Platanthera zijinensis]|uniref:Uncharacterized protein n=1 Tax=Platanthera zijinensis TaxID=2320716 RepID=A0AAP0BWH3_9ASPA
MPPLPPPNPLSPTLCSPHAKPDKDPSFPINTTAFQPHLRLTADELPFSSGGVGRVPDVRVQGAALPEDAEPRLDPLPVRSPRGESAAARPDEVSVPRHRLPGIPADGELPAGAGLRVRARRIRVLAASDEISNAGLRGRAVLPAPGLLLRAHGGGVETGGY